jgi:hypothetical protein
VGGFGKNVGGNGLLRGGDEGVIVLMRTFPLPFIHEVLLPGQTTIDSPGESDDFLHDAPGGRIRVGNVEEGLKGGRSGE